MAGAAWQWLRSGERRGASTISMQVASLLTPALRRQGGPRTLTQKWRQMRTAWALETRWSKTEILETYLNRVTFRGESGVGAASAVLFAKTPHGLTEPEAVVLAALIRAPNSGREATLRRAWAVRQAAGGQSSREEIAALAARSRTRRGDGTALALAPHAAWRLLAEMAPAVQRDDLHDAGCARAAPRHRTAGHHLLAVGTAASRTGPSGGGQRHRRHPRLRRQQRDPLRASQVDGIQARRQAGSTLKPFLYGLALERRLLTPARCWRTPHSTSRRRRALPAAQLRRPLPGDAHAEDGAGRLGQCPRCSDARLGGTGRLRDTAYPSRLRRLTESGDFYGPSLALGRPMSASGSW